MKTKLRFLSRPLHFLISAVAALLPAQASDSLIGVNFTGANANGAPTSLASDEAAGVVVQSSWNNFGEGSVLRYPLRDSSGNLTAINVSYATGEMWGSGTFNENLGFATPDSKLLNGYLNARTGPSESTNVIALGGLNPAATYDVIAYTLRDSPGAQAAYWINDLYAEAYHILTEGRDDWYADPQFRMSSNTTLDAEGFVPDDLANRGNYVRWNGVSPKADGTLTISVASELNLSGNLQRGPINGIQLISSADFPANTQTPQFVLPPRDVRVRIGQVGTFRATVDGPWTFQWYRNDAEIPGATGSSFSTPPIENIQDTLVNFKLRVSNGARTLTSANLNLVLVPELPEGGLFYDGFDYPAGDLGNWGEWNETNPNAKLTGVGPATVSATGLAYTDEAGRSLQVSGGSLIPPRETSGWNSPDYLPIKAFEAPQGGPNTVLFMSYLFDFNNRVGGGIGFSGFEIVSGTPLDWGNERFWVGTRGTVFGFDSGLPGSPLSSVPTATNGLVVVRLTQDDTTATAELYFNPPLDALPEFPNLTVVKSGTVTFNGVGVNAGDWNKLDPDGAGPFIDEFRFGLTYASVAPIAENRPILAAELVGSSIRVSWPSDATGYALEMTDNLSSGTWSSAPAGNPVLVPTSGKGSWFRLIK